MAVRYKRMEISREQKSVTDSTYNGWQNWETWNVSLWILNNETLYGKALRYVQGSARPSYSEFVKSEGLEGSETPDGVAFTDDRLGIEDLDELMEELLQ